MTFLQRIAPQLLLFLLFLSNNLASQPLEDMESNNGERELLKIQRLYTGNTGISGRFTQTKTLHNFQFPIVSSGVFQIDQQGALNWSVQKPIESTITIDHKGTLLIPHKTGATNQLSANTAANSIGNQITQIIHAVLAMNWSVLKQHFHIDIEQSVPVWQLHLTPKSATIAGTISIITLQGESVLQSVSVIDTQQDKTTIVFETDPR